MIRRPPRSTRTDTLFPDTTLFRSVPDYTPAGMTAKAAALPGWQARLAAIDPAGWPVEQADDYLLVKRSEEHTSELQSLMRISYAVFCLKKKKIEMRKQINAQNNQQYISTHTRQDTHETSNNI